MDTTQGASGDDLVVLDEWHVRALVNAELRGQEANELRELIGADLGSWTAGLDERLGARVPVRVEIDR